MWCLHFLHLALAAALIVTCLDHSVCESDHQFKWLALEHARVCYTSDDNCVLQSVNDDSIHSYCCGSCTCGPDCRKHGICCLGQYNNLSDARESTENNIYRCVPGQYNLDKETKYGTDQAYWMISKCNLAYPNNVNKTRCENPGHDVAIDTIIPVTDSIGKEIFRNKYCYYCNSYIGNVYHLIPWTAAVRSEKEINSSNKMFWDELKEQRGTVIFRPPTFIPTNTCFKYQPSFHISTCNVTGLWPVYNKSIEAACESFIDSFNNTYKNYYCYLCNIGEHLSKNEWRCNRTGSQVNFLPPFTAILDITVVDTNYEYGKDIFTCGTKQFADYKRMVCRDIQCHYLRDLINGQCRRHNIWQDFLEDVADSPCFLTLFELTPYPNSTPLNLLDRESEPLPHNILNAILDLIDLQYLDKFRVIQFFAHENGILEYAIVLLLIPFDMDVYYDHYYNIFDRLVYLGANNVSLKLADYSMKFLLNLVQYNISIYNGVATVFLSLKADRLMRKLDNEYIRDPVLDFCANQSIITINKLNVCPFVQISLDEFSMKIENNFLQFDGKTNYTRTFSKWEYEKHGKNISICLDDFIDIYQEISQPVFKTQVGVTNELQPKNILSLVCVCVSIVCLIITIATYGVFSVLQSQPGVNNLLLAMFLLLAQSFYQFGAGQNTVSGWVCALIGGICHFFWLAVMFAMNVCCIQMVYSFRKHIIISKRYVMSQTVRNISYIICASLLFICVNVVVSLVLSNGQSCGYGGELCYISTSTMQLITFVLPSIVALLANFFMFVYVVYEIRRVVQSTLMLNREKNYLHVYVRLSVLTGLTWIVGFLQLVLKLEWLEYIFIIFNASQGVFIMIAFVLNKRVMSMICKGKQGSSTLNKTPVNP